MGAADQAKAAAVLQMKMTTKPVRAITKKNLVTKENAIIGLLNCGPNVHFSMGSSLYEKKR